MFKRQHETNSQNPVILEGFLNALCYTNFKHGTMGKQGRPQPKVQMLGSDCLSYFLAVPALNDAEDTKGSL